MLSLSTVPNCYSFFLQGIPEVWLGLDLCLCRLLCLSPVLLSATIPRSLPAPPIQAGGGRGLVGRIPTAAGIIGERHRELLRAPGFLSGGPGRRRQRPASAAAPGGGEQGGVCGLGDAVAGVRGLGGHLLALPLLPHLGRGNGAVWALSDSGWGIWGAIASALSVLRAAVVTLDLLVALPASVLPPVPHTVAGGCAGLPDLARALPGLVPDGA